MDFLFILVPGPRRGSYGAGAQQADAAETAVGSRLLPQKVFSGFQGAEPAQVGVGNQPAAEHGASARIVGGSDVHA